MINKFFDIVICLTQRNRPDRWQLLEQEIEKGIQIEPFYAIEHKDSKVSFCLSQIEMLKMFLASDAQTALLLEDDVQFRNLNRFEDIVKELTKWDLFYLGANCKPYPECILPIRVSKHIVKIHSAWCTHAVGYTRGMAQYIVDNYEYQGGQLYDTWLDINILPKFDCYISVPMLAYQKPVRSDLWETVVDYTDTWKASDDYLLSL
jgi:hypothetical protein